MAMALRSAAGIEGTAGVGIVSANVTTESLSQRHTDIRVLNSFGDFAGYSCFPIQFEEILRGLVGIISRHETTCHCACSGRFQKIQAPGSDAAPAWIKEGDLLVLSNSQPDASHVIVQQRDVRLINKC
jgi:hypothetical protein